MTHKAINIDDLQKLARRRLPKPIYDYLEGGGDDEMAIRNNQERFADYQLLPETLIDVSNIDLKTKILGAELDLPFYISPIGQSRFFHPDCDLAGVQGAEKFGTLFSLSSFSGKTIEAIAEASATPKMFQIYVMNDEELNRQLIDRCKAANYCALCLTVDTIVGGNRERDIRNGLTIPPKLSLASMFDFATKPKWVYNYLMDDGRDLANLDDAPDQKDSASFLKYMNSILKKKLTWEDAERMVEYWGGPFAIKGISSPKDAVRAKEIGASAVIISNHGGRQLDSAPAPIEMIAEIRKAVGDDMEIVMDGGIKRGSDIVKALALGANACSIGRAYVYGLSAGGQDGVERTLKILKTEVERDLALIGCSTINDVSSHHIRRKNAKG